MSFDVVSLFSGIGGLDLGFTIAKFNVIWANDNSPSTWETYEKNHPNTVLDRRSITQITDDEIPDCDVIIGGPPCQSWSIAGSNKGVKDSRGKLFYEYLRVIKAKKPKIFVAENVEGILRKTHKLEFDKIISNFEQIGYAVHYKLLNAAEYGTPQDRKRVIIVGIRMDITDNYEYPLKNKQLITLEQAIGDLSDHKIDHVTRHDTVNNNIDIYLQDTWSSQFMSRNRVRGWDEVSYTIPATARQVPLHPQAPKMIKVNTDKFEFAINDGTYRYNGIDLYRRLTVHECARIQTFPDTYKLYFDKIEDGYKILGNAVPVELAKCIAISVMSFLSTCKVNNKPKVLIKIKAKPT